MLLSLRPTPQDSTGLKPNSRDHYGLYIIIDDHQTPLATVHKCFFASRDPAWYLKMGFIVHGLLSRSHYRAADQLSTINNQQPTIKSQHPGFRTFGGSRPPTRWTTRIKWRLLRKWKNIYTFSSINKLRYVTVPYGGCADTKPNYPYSRIAQARSERLENAHPVLF